MQTKRNETIGVVRATPIHTTGSAVTSVSKNKKITPSLESELFDSKPLSDALQLAAGLLFRPGHQRVTDSRPKILAMLKARDVATRSDVESVEILPDSLTK
jgi:hypothetical protein